MKKNYQILILIVVVIITGSIGYYAYTASQYNQEVKKVKIGAIIPLTGRAAYWGEVNNEGIKLAVEKIKEKYGEDSVEVIIEDSQSDSNVAVNAANKLINFDKVDFIYTELSGPSGAVSPIAKAADKLFIFDAFSPAALETNPQAIKTFMDHEVICRQYASSAKAKGFDKLAIVGDAAAGLAPYCVKGLTPTYDENQIFIQDITPEDDLRSVVVKTKQAEVDAVIFIGYEPSALRLLKLRAELDWQIEFISSKTNVSENVQNEVGLKNLNDVVLFEVKLNSKFKEKYLSQFPETNPAHIPGAAFAYDAIMALFLGNQECVNHDAQCTVDYLISQNEIPTAIESYANQGRSLVPEINYYEIKDQKFKLITL
jgi:branched-chain amino acid transport system substrate-binding protein